ncbi:chromate efflux transporter [Kineosporia sp. NBRC 101731]|uniref:chromate efflux transporter n=1 Tax=Kineosporia sp. NBRC 101731 TaxID=3032199 RepID=UPI0024A3DD87|nr:chromate efflux transporter [Kineosporia sp. NBRC 101731]GLY29152.1 chromate transporter [Kineosporia sp. NBRC 101731]
MTEAPPRHPGSAGEVFRVFLQLGLTSFGGPVAHLGYFREALVVRRRWLSEQAYADVVALCQFLPGPASSQVGMALGLQRAGFAGLLAAWTAFTLPSAVLLMAFAYAVTELGGSTGTGWILGLKAAAVAVVAQAVMGMAGSLAPDRPRATVAGAATVAALLAPQAWAQPAIIAAAALAGLVWLRPDAATPATGEAGEEEDFPDVRVPRGVALGSLATFFVLLVAVPILPRLFGIFYRAGALVFGGGHVVLPLLESGLVPAGLVGHDEFLAGYGAAQAVPGPLFTVAAYLGAIADGVPGALVALVAIFLPAALLVVGVLPFWQSLRHVPSARAALMGVNAGVVGLLAAALYDPVFTDGITSARALALAVAAFVLLTRWPVPAWAVVIAAAAVGAVAL